MDEGNIIEISEVLGSKKRTVLLFLLNNQPMGYTQIEKGFKRKEIKIGSSEIYKHLNVLMRHRYIAKRGKIYLVTLKGKKMVESLDSLNNVPATVPRLEMVF
jgi:predicted transcriptional regulator